MGDKEWVKRSNTVELTEDYEEYAKKSLLLQFEWSNKDSDKVVFVLRTATYSSLVWRKSTGKYEASETAMVQEVQHFDWGHGIQSTH